MMRHYTHQSKTCFDQTLYRRTSKWEECRVTGLVGVGGAGKPTPIAIVPEWLQTATGINPLGYIVIARRQIFLGGADPAFIWPQL